MSLNEDAKAAFIHKLQHLRRFSAGGPPALHKPLLLLYALAELKLRQRETVSYREADTVITPLLQKFGPPGTRARVSDPFARLEGDGLWQIRAVDRAALFDRGGNARPSALLKQNAEAGFDPGSIEALTSIPGLMDEAISLLLESNVPQDARAEVCKKLGLAVG
jgi:putative restriction endonuclease